MVKPLANISEFDMTEPTKPARETRKSLLTPLEFARIADLAWRTDPRGSLARQISDATGVSESSIERWLKDERHPAPAERIAEALRLADKRMHENSDFLYNVAMTLAKNPS
jgi:transcriptional regulator with XRE-family HTH domain